MWLRSNKVKNEEIYYAVEFSLLLNDRIDKKYKEEYSKDYGVIDFAIFLGDEVYTEYKDGMIDVTRVKLINKKGIEIQDKQEREKVIRNLKRMDIEKHCEEVEKKMLNISASDNYGEEEVEELSLITLLAFVVVGFVVYLMYKYV